MESGKCLSRSGSGYLCHIARLYTNFTHQSINLGLPKISFSKAATRGVLRNFTKITGKHLHQSLRPEAYNFVKKETLAQVFSCEFCEISKNTYFTEHLRTTASTFLTFSSGNHFFVPPNKFVLIYR